MKHVVMHSESATTDKEESDAFCLEFQKLFETVHNIVHNKFSIVMKLIYFEAHAETSLHKEYSWA